MGRLGITNVLPLTGGQGITVVGNKINLGGELTKSIEIITNEHEILLTYGIFNAVRLNAVYIDIVNTDIAKQIRLTAEQAKTENLSSGQYTSILTDGIDYNGLVTSLGALIGNTIIANDSISAKISGQDIRIPVETV